MYRDAHRLPNFQIPLLFRKTIIVFRSMFHDYIRIESGNSGDWIT